MKLCQVYFIMIVCLSLIATSSCKHKKNTFDFYNSVVHNQNHLKSKFADTCFEKGLYCVEHDEYQSAKEWFLLADSANPNTPVILNGIGNTEVKTGDTIGAFLVFEKALKIDSSFTKTYVNYGCSLNSVKNFEGARRILQLGLNRIAKYKYDRGLLYMNLAGSYHMLGQDSEALVSLDSAKEVIRHGDLYDKIVAFEHQIRQ